MVKKRTKNRIFNSVVGVLVVLGLVWVCSRFVHLGKVVYTDNAQVKQLIVPVNVRVQGFVSKIYFEEYQSVSKGDTLMIIEDTELRFHLAQAEANYQNALSGKLVAASTINTTESNIAVSDAILKEAKIRLENDEREYKRYKNLYIQDAVTKQQYEAVETNYEASKVRYEQLNRQKQSTALVKQEHGQRLTQTEAGIKLAEAALELAKLNLSYTVVLAPCNGVAGRKNVQEGQLVQPGQTIVDIVDGEDKWVIANYKETQTAKIKEGQEVDIEVDAIPGVVFKGVVKSLSGATGASYSLIPQDNSAGNFVKVEQRIPVRIEFNKDNRLEDLERLCSGMNVECEVKY